MIASLIAYVLIAMLGFAIKENDYDKEWKDKKWQERRYIYAKKMGYDLYNPVRREKMRKKYGYAYDPLMKGKPFDITSGEYYKIKEEKNSENK